MGDPPTDCDYWRSDLKRCGQLTKAEEGLKIWHMLSCGSKVIVDSELACALMEHYMGASGKDVNIDVDKLLGSPEFSDAVGKTMAGIKKRAVAMCKTPPCTYTFDSGWTPMSFNRGDSEDLYFAYRGMTYQVTGSITVGKGGKTSGGAR